MSTVKEKREEAERESKMRRRVYPRWIEQKRMTQAAADRQIALMDEIVEDYRKLEQKDQLL